MRILQVVHGFPPCDWAGTELVTLYLSHALRTRGHEVTVLTRVADPTAAEFSVREEEVEGLPVVRIVNNYIQTNTFRLFYDNSFYDTSFVQLLRRLQPDVVHFQHLAHLSVSLLLLSVNLGYPTVLSLHDFFFPCFRLHLIDAQTRLCPGPERGERCVACLQEVAPPEEAQRRFSYMEGALQAPDLVIAPSAFLAQRMLGYFPTLQERLRVIPLGVKPISGVKRAQSPQHPLRILYVGLLFPPKGAHLLMEALKGVPPDTFTASFYGAVEPFWQPYADHLREEAQGLPVSFYGAYPHDQLAAILARHDVLVMPGICEETFSLLAREAQMAGLPIVAAARGALLDVVQDGVNGLFFEPENAAELKRCLTRLINKPDLVAQLRAVNPAVKTLEEYTKDIEGVYTEICAEPSRIPLLQKRLAEQYQFCSALLRENEQLRVETQELTTQNASLRFERDRLEVDRLQLGQERDRLLTIVQDLRAALAADEQRVRERDARLEAIYASLTWKLYRGYAALKAALFHRPLTKLKRWLVG
jgi:glycosyltransferase involved in cell wall biosynthesis